MKKVKQRPWKELRELKKKNVHEINSNIMGFFVVVVCLFCFSC